MESRSLRREVFFLGDQLGLRDVTYKPVIGTLQWGIVVFRSATRHQVKQKPIQISRCSLHILS